MGLEGDIAVLSLEPAEIERSLNVTFERGEDGLDRFRAAIIKITDNIFFALQRYDHYPVPGTKLIMAHTPRAAMDWIVRALALDAEHVQWAAPNAKTSLDRAIARRHLRNVYLRERGRRDEHEEAPPVQRSYRHV